MLFICFQIETIIHLSLRRKLEDKLVSDSTIKEVLEAISFYLDDNAWLSCKLQREFARGYGSRAMQAKFIKAGVFIERGLIEKIITEDKQKEKMVAILKWLFSRRRFDREKALSYLIRRG